MNIRENNHREVAVGGVAPTAASAVQRAQVKASDRSGGIFHEIPPGYDATEPR
jgi:hypothetical protein